MKLSNSKFDLFFTNQFSLYAKSILDTAGFQETF